MFVSSNLDRMLNALKFLEEGKLVGVLDLVLKEPELVELAVLDKLDSILTSFPGETLQQWNYLKLNCG